MSRREYHTLGDLNNKDLCLAVLEAEKSQIRVLADLVSVEDPLPILQTAAFLPYPQMSERNIISLMSLLMRAVIPHEGSTLMT